eukprot:7551520-Pyramimonas_sp.AAC.1
MPCPKGSIFCPATKIDAKLSCKDMSQRRSASVSEHHWTPKKDTAAIATSRTTARLPALRRAVW